MLRLFVVLAIAAVVFLSACTFKLGADKLGVEGSSMASRSLVVPQERNNSAVLLVKQPVYV